MNFELKQLDLKAKVTWIARILLIGYAIVLPIKKTATLQAVLLLTAFAFLLWEHRAALYHAWQEACWLLRPLFIFSLWIFLICSFWDKPALKVESNLDIHQPWFSLNLWRRDIAQPMVALLCGFWAFRQTSWKQRLFLAQSAFLMILSVKCLYQFYIGQSIDGIINKGTLVVQGFSLDNIFFSYVLFLLTPGILWLILKHKKDWRKLFSWGIFLILLSLIFLNKRRGTWIALYIEMLFITAWIGRRVFLSFALSTVLLGVAAYQVRPEWFSREYDTNNISRIKTYQDFYPLLDKHPFVGAGFGKNTVGKNYGNVIYQQAHNTFANLALEIGFPGLALWLVVLGIYANRFWKACINHWSARIGLAFLIGFCVRNLTDDVWIASNAELFWFLIGVLMPNREEKKL